MRNATLFSCAFAIATLAAAGMAHAAGSAMTTAPKADLARAQQARAQVQAHVGQSKTAALKAGVAGAKPSGPQPAEFFANPHRAYPPSCLNSPMQFGMWHDDPNAKVATVNLIGDPYAGGSEATYVEPVTVYVFRVSCAGGLSATLMEFDRSSANEGNTSLYPTLPAVSVPLGGSNFYVRFADDPNTFFSTSYALNPLISSDVFVLENFYTGSTQLDYNQAFTLTLDNLNTADPNRFTDFNLGAYNPAQYPQAALPLPISGYLTGNWRDVNHSGEGIQTEVIEGDNTDGSVSHYISVAWYTYDSLGIPYWLFGSGSFNVGDTSATMQLAYYAGGGFAGKFGSSATPALWGTLSVQFLDCNTMRFTYQPTPGLDPSVPQDSGTRTWTRATTINGLTCQ